MQEGNSFLPWFNSNTIDFLKTYIKPRMNVFEYGSGYSTLFFAQMGCNVYGVETRQEWFTRVQVLAKENSLLQNIAISLCKTTEEFICSIINYDMTFDIIVIDSIARIKCLEFVKTFYKKGIIVLDNSERYNLQTAKTIMSGFESIDFAGLGPGRLEPSQATIFWKNL